jgi:hypothetical protein
MADEPPMIFRKVLGGLRPVNAAATEALNAIDDKPVRVRITQTRGNQARNAEYIDWSLRTLAHWLGCSEEELRTEGRAAA